MSKPQLKTKNFKFEISIWNFRRGRGGFSLLELLVVIAIMAILVALGAVSYSTAQKKTRDSRVKSDLKEIQNALEAYYAVTAAYPDALDDLDSSYMPAGVPSDPKTGGDYHYTIDGTNENYCLCSYELEMGGGNAVDDGETGGGTCDFTDTTFSCLSNLQ